MQIFTTKHMYYDHHIGLEESSLKISEEQKIKNESSVYIQTLPTKFG